MLLILSMNKWQIKIPGTPPVLSPAATVPPIRQRMPSIARGTVYRNLKLMEQDREIARLEMPAGPDRYDRTTAPHGHLYCDGCQKLTDIPVVGLVRELEAAIGTEVRSYQLTVHYLCPDCRRKQAQ